MRLKELTEGVPYEAAGAVSEEEDIAFLTDRSYECGPGALFFAIRGSSADGGAYINDAARLGAKAYVSERALNSDIPGVIVADVRAAMAKMAANFYYNAHKNLDIITVTGTNGKTTTCNMIAHILSENGSNTAVFGTLGAFINGRRIDSRLTTPDPIELHRLFQIAYLSGVKYVVMEVSAHAIYLKKMAGVKAKIAVFTNLSRDHLDFFGDMESYAAAKTSYFTPGYAEYAVVNSDDETGRRIINSSRIPTAAYGIENPADTFCIDYDCTRKIRCVVNSFDDIFELKTQFCGKFNLYNALAAVTAARVAGVKTEVIRRALFDMGEVDGRFNVLEGGKRVVIDYAHTPDGLKNLLAAARSFKGDLGRVIVVFGCGGDRDRGKRAQMGAVAAEYADFSVLTSDNPRTEDPALIISDIEKGFPREAARYIAIPDRGSAITYALLISKRDDVVVIAGKGAENYLDVGGEKKPYSDRAEVLETFRRYNL